MGFFSKLFGKKGLKSTTGSRHPEVPLSDFAQSVFEKKKELEINAKNELDKENKENFDKIKKRYQDEILILIRVGVNYVNLCDIGRGCIGFNYDCFTHQKETNEPFLISLLESDGFRVLIDTKGMKYIVVDGV